MNRIAALFASLGAAMLLAATPLHAQTKNPDNPEASPIWQKVRASLFEQRPIAAAADDKLLLETPVRAEDAAVVPISIKAHWPQNESRYVEKLYLVIDNNPSPIAAIFSFTPASGRADIETRVRIDEYTHVRAIAQMNDGALYMTSRFVKASGGCSAPPGKDQAAALASLGKMKLRVEGEVAYDKPVLAQLMVSHPNSSGLAMDQVTRNYIPAHFVRKVDVSYASKPVMSADLDISISENPNIRFYFVPRGEGELKVHVVDSDALQFDSGLKIQPAL